MISIEKNNLPVLVSGARTAFLESAGAYWELMSYELGALALKGLIERSGIAPNLVEQVVMGTVLHEINTTNVAREISLQAELSPAIPAYTVAMAGLSPNIGIMNVCNEIALGRIGFGVAGGTENFSDVPIRLSQNVRRTMMKIRQTRSNKEKIKHLSKLRPRDLALDLPSSSDFTTGLTMGSACEAMADTFGVSRNDSDQFAVQSHQRALHAQSLGLYKEQIIPVQLGTKSINEDNSIRPDTTFKKLSELKPVFDCRGVITAGNSSRFTDGAGAVLLGSMKSVKQHGLTPQLIIRDYLATGVGSLHTEMLLGPALTIPKLLERNKLKFEDIGVWELHEAFASQVLVNLKCMRSRRFINDRFGKSTPHGDIPMEQLNAHGGSLAMGNPFAATGIRLLQTAAKRLKTEQQRYAIVASCAGGGLGSALLLENIS